MAQAGNGISVDPTFRLTGNLCLEIFSDTDYDPWVMRLPKITFVGMASQSKRESGVHDHDD